MKTQISRKEVVKKIVKMLAAEKGYGLEYIFNNCSQDCHGRASRDENGNFILDDLAWRTKKMQLK